MTPAYQTRYGPIGNCFAACVATILDRPIFDLAEMFPEEEDIPDHPDRWHRKIDRCLSRLGYAYFEVWAGSDRIFKTAMKDKSYVILGVKNPGPGGLGHAVVAQVVHRECDQPGMVRLCFDVIHDPAGREEPLTYWDDKVECFIVLYPSGDRSLIPQEPAPPFERATGWQTLYGQEGAPYTRILPIDDTGYHNAVGETCGCNPRVIRDVHPENGRPLIFPMVLHNAYDGRSTY